MTKDKKIYTGYARVGTEEQLTGKRSRLKQVRETRGLSQSKLAEASGVSVRMIQHYEQGVKDINFAAAITVYRLARALDCTVEFLLENK